VRIAQRAVALDPEFTSVVVFDLSHGDFPLIVFVVIGASSQLLQVRHPAYQWLLKSSLQTQELDEKSANYAQKTHDDSKILGFLLIGRQSQI
jgi:hypothetical protein